MMKKFLALALVLGIAGLASAGLQITVNGVVVDEITINPSDMVELGIFSDDAGVLEDGYMQVFTGPGSYNISEAHNYFNPGGRDEGFVVEIDATTLFWDFAKPSLPVNMPLNALMGDKLMFHCDGLGDVIVTLSALGSYGNVDTDTIVIHQVLPEPITMVLLSLGGLFIRKR